MSDTDDVLSSKDANGDARQELLTAIKQAAAFVRKEQDGRTSYVDKHAALLALSQAWAALQPRDAS